MGKISGDNKDVLSQLKDHYAQRERESENRHREELGSVKQTHQVEIEKLRAENEARIQKVRDDAAGKLSQKDLQFQKEIEAMRAMYSKKAAEAKKG